MSRSDSENVSSAVQIPLFPGYGNRSGGVKKRTAKVAAHRSFTGGHMKLKYTAVWVGFTAAAMVAVSAGGSEGVKKAADVVDKSDAIMAALARATDRTEDLGSAEVRISTATTGAAPITMEG